MTTGTNTLSAKDETRAQWKAAAQGWSDSSAVIRPWLHEATAAMIAMAGIVPGARVLDVAAGAGDQTLDIARRVGPRGRVLATDLSPDILDLARRNAAAAGLRNIDVQVADGEDLAVGEAGFDAVVCRLGLMLFGDPLAGLRGMHRALRPGGGICTMVFSTPQDNPCIAILMATALAHAGLPPPDPYRPGGLLSLGKPGLIDDLFRQAGFTQIATTKLAAPFRLAGVEDYLDFVKRSAAPVVGILQRLDATRRAAAWADIAQRLACFETNAGWEGPNELLLTAARR